MTILLGDFGKIDEGLQRLDLTKEQPSAAIGSTPIIEKPGGYTGDVVRIAPSRQTFTQWRISLIVLFSSTRVLRPVFESRFASPFPSSWVWQWG